MAVIFPEEPGKDEMVTDDASGRVWRWEEAQNRWVLIRQYYIPVPGPAGDRGIPGPVSEVAGPQGERGFTGAPGADGPTGLGIQLVGEVETVAELGEASSFNPGDAFWVKANGSLAIVSQTNPQEWVYDVLIRGPQGPQGEDGIGVPGEPGTDGEDGYANCEVINFAPPNGPKGKLWIDNLNRVYVTTGL